MLYVVATPIGNREDITLRALKILFSVDIILCEDTAKTLDLLRHYQKPDQKIPELISYYEENERKRIPEVIAKLKLGKEIALVTNSGTPTISDPGFRLVRECWQKEIKVVPIPGPSSPIAALSVSGLPTDKFLFIGFLPNKSGARIKMFKTINESQKSVPATVVFFESPFRISQSLVDLKEVFGDIKIVIAREITKIYEEIKFERLSFFLEKYQTLPKGEFMILFNLKEQD